MAMLPPKKKEWISSLPALLWDCRKPPEPPETTAPSGPGFQRFDHRCTSALAIGNVKIMAQRMGMMWGPPTISPGGVSGITRDLVAGCQVWLFLWWLEFWLLQSVCGLKIAWKCSIGNTFKKMTQKIAMLGNFAGWSHGLVNSYEVIQEDTWNLWSTQVAQLCKSCYFHCSALLSKQPLTPCFFWYEKTSFDFGFRWHRYLYAMFTFLASLGVEAPLFVMKPPSLKQQRKHTNYLQRKMLYIYQGETPWPRIARILHPKKGWPWKFWVRFQPLEVMAILTFALFWSKPGPKGSYGAGSPTQQIHSSHKRRIVQKHVVQWLIVAVTPATTAPMNQW